MTTKSADSLVLTGNTGLDDILDGGLTPNRLYLLEGNPGAGKTTLALEFLMTGVHQGQKGLYVTLSETREELLAMASSHGWEVGDAGIFELIPNEENLRPDSQYTVFHPSEVELNETTKAVLKRVEELKPSRVVFDSLSEMRLLAQNPLRFRRQILALKQFFVGRNCTVLMLDDRTADSDTQMDSIAHGVISLDRLSPEYGAERRRLEIKKMRGRAYRGGFHDFVIRTGGLQVFPRLVAAEHSVEVPTDLIKSGSAPIDKLLCGGLERGTSTLLTGPAGVGKSTLALLFAISAAKRGEKTLYCSFDESLHTFKRRAQGLGFPLEQFLQSGLIMHIQGDPGGLPPGQLIAMIRDGVRAGVKVLVIDSLNGYLNAMPAERYLTIQLHEVLTYLSQMGVNTFLIAAQLGLLGPNMHSVIDASYLADTVLLLRYFEAGGRVRKALSVLKKRSGPHEDTIREFSLNSTGIKVSEPLDQFRGVLSGIPVIEQSSADLSALLK